jgi:hypothetical protein
MAVNFQKLLEHPDVQLIIDKLALGETPESVSSYLKSKYDGPTEGNLRLSTNLLKEFVKTYGNTSEFVDKLIIDAKNNNIDKQISQSLLNNKVWKERVAEIVDEKIDIEKKIIQQLTILEQRQEQIFDKIQENPGSTKLDYVMTKYFELNAMLLEKADKIINKTPDQRIEHTFTVQMVEQHSNVIQEAVRRVISRLPPDQASEFMQMLAEELSSLKTPIFSSTPPTNKAIEKDLSYLEGKIEAIDTEFKEL